MNAPEPMPNPEPADHYDEAYADDLRDLRASSTTDTEEKSHERHSHR